MRYMQVYSYHLKGKIQLFFVINPFMYDYVKDGGLGGISQRGLKGRGGRTHFRSNFSKF